ncbi:MAG: hypothetical protein HGA96_06190 [Desulfobulbaceae bacterium]|nr:hypothetical protein [Desulfobulbaceae bacterium]
MKYIMNISCAFLMLLYSWIGVGMTCAEQAGVDLLAAKQKMSVVALESLEAEYFPASKVVNIKGSLRNISNSYVRGFVTVFLLSQSGVVLNAFDMQINDHRPIMDGETVVFSTAINVTNVSGASRVSVEFTKD